MSDSELDRTLVHPEQTQDFVHFGLTTAIDSSVTTILPLVAYHQQHQHHPHETTNQPCFSPSASSSSRHLPALNHHRHHHHHRQLPVASGEPESHYVPYCDMAGGAHQMQLRHPVAFARHIHSPISHQDDQPKRISTSLPLYYAKVSVLDIFEVLDDDECERSDLCTLGSRPGMEYVPLRTPAAEPYHYHHVTDQTKSLQELQNEVGALLEFRDLVIETFPDLKTKMASSATNSTLTGIPSSSSSLATTRREWEPGIRIRRKLTVQKEPFGSGGGGGSVTNAAASCSIGGSVTNTSSGSTTGERTVGSGLTSIPPATSATNISSTISGTGASSSTGIVGATPPTIIHNISSSSTSDLNHPHPQQHHPPHQHSHGSGSGHHHQQQQQQQQQPQQQQQQQQQQQHSSSSLIRSRSNSHSGKKEPKSGEGNNGSVIQDSGFSTETSSSKETHSAASSTSGAVQGTGSSTATNRLAVETENELWNLLDVIHRKSSRLRDELDLLPHHVLTERASEKLRPTNLLTGNQHQQQQYVGGAGGPSAPSSAASSAQRHHHHLHDSSGSHNIVIHHCNPAEVSAGGGDGGGTLDVIPSVAPVTDAITTGTTTVVVAVTGGGEGAGNGLADNGRHHEDPSGGALALPVVVAAKDHIVQILRNERDRLLEKMAGYEAETVAGRIRTAKMQDEVDTLTLTVRSLHEQLKAAHSQQLELNSKLHDLHHHHHQQPQPVNRSGTPSSSESIKALIPHQQPGSVSQGEHPAKASRFHAAAPSVENSSSGGCGSTGTTVPKSSAAAAAGVGGSAVTLLPPLDDDDDGDDDRRTAERVVDLPATGDSASVAVRGRPLDVGSLGRLDALLGPPGGGGTLRLQKVRSLDSQKFAAILLETNIVELQRHLLTVTVQNQVLQQRLEQATRSRIFLSAKFEKSKEDVDDLRFQLKEKSIELEGTKAQLRVIESKAAASSSSKSSSSSAAGSPEHHHQQQQQHIITVGAHAMLLPSSLHHHHHHQMHQQQQRQSPLLHLNHHHASTMASNSQLAMRLPSSQVSTPSMKAMTPVAMDDIAQQHSSSTESAQDQAERDSSTTTTGGSRQQHQQHQYHNHLQQQQPQCPETPRRRPSKIPLPGMKGSSAPKPPSGRNFSAAVAAAAAASTTPTTPTIAGAGDGGVRPLAAASGGSTASSGPLSNRSLTKSTGSLYVKSSDASYFGTQQQQQQQPPPTTHGTPSGRARESNSSGGSSSGSLYRPDSAQSWRTSSKDTPSLEKLRSSSIPISAAKSPAAAASSKAFMASSAVVSPSMIPAGPSGTGYGVTAGSTVTSSSPQPRTKRDSLTTKVKNCDSLSRWQQQVVATSNSGGSNHSGVVGNKGTPGAVSGASVSVVVGAATVSGGSHHPPPPVRERKQSGGGSVAVGGGLMMRHSSSGTTGSSVGSGSQIAAAATDASNGNSSNSNSSSVQQPNTNSAVAPAATGDTIKARRSNTFRVSKPTVLVPLLPPAAAEQDCRYLMPEIGTDAVRPLRGIVGGPDGPEASGLIGEYLAAKTRGSTVHQQQQSPQSQTQALLASPPPIFHVTGRAVPAVNGAAQRQILEFAYKHPILLLDDDGNDDHGKAEHVTDDGTVEESTAATAQESLIIPHLTGGPREMRWATPPQPLPDSGTETAIAATGSGLVGKVNRNILKTWEQLRWACGGLASETKRDNGAPVSGEHNTAQQRYCGGQHQQQQLQQQQQAYHLPFRSNGIDQLGGDSDGGDSSTERQSCVLYCPQQHQHHLLSEELIDFKVNRLLHSPASGGSTDRLTSTGSFSIMAAASTITTTTAVTKATAGGSFGVVRTTAGSSSEGGEFYDSIDAVVSTNHRASGGGTTSSSGSNVAEDCPRQQQQQQQRQQQQQTTATSGGHLFSPFTSGGDSERGKAPKAPGLTSIDRKSRLLRSIEIE